MYGDLQGITAPPETFPLSRQEKKTLRKRRLQGRLAPTVETARQNRCPDHHLHDELRSHQALGPRTPVSAEAPAAILNSVDAIVHTPVILPVAFLITPRSSWSRAVKLIANKIDTAIKITPASRLTGYVCRLDRRLTVSSSSGRRRRSVAVGSLVDTRIRGKGGNRHLCLLRNEQL